MDSMGTILSKRVGPDKTPVSNLILIITKVIDGARDCAPRAILVYDTLTNRLFVLRICHDRESASRDLAQAFRKRHISHGRKNIQTASLNANLIWLKIQSFTLINFNLS